MAQAPTGKGREKLTEPWVSDTESWDPSTEDSDVEDTKRELERKASDESFRKSNKKSIDDLDLLLMKGNLILEGINPDTWKPFEESFYDINETGRPKAGEESTLLKKSSDQVSDVLKNTAEADKEEKKSTLRRGLMLFIGLTIAGISAYAAYEVIKRQVNGRGSSDIDIPEDTRKAIVELVDKWQKEPDSNFWNDFANGIDAGLFVMGKKESFTIADQIIFLNMVIDTNKLIDIWKWEQSIDIENNAEDIKKFYDSSKITSDIYRHVVEVKYKNQVMPRPIAAAQLKVVLGWILAEDCS
jgi:hypothetical protein